MNEEQIEKKETIIFEGGEDKIFSDFVTMSKGLEYSYILKCKPVRKGVTKDLGAACRDQKELVKTVLIFSEMGYATFVEEINNPYKSLFKNLELVINSDDGTIAEKVSGIIYILVNEDKEKYDSVINLTNSEVDYEQVSYAIIGGEVKEGSGVTYLKEYNAKFMWLLRYGFCDGDEDLTVKLYELITGRPVEAM